MKQLSCKLNIPILVLVDANPFGIEIMCVYRFGSNVRNKEQPYLLYNLICTLTNKCM